MQREVAKGVLSARARSENKRGVHNVPGLKQEQINLAQGALHQTDDVIYRA
jgi:hypothetical protein